MKDNYIISLADIPTRKEAPVVVKLFSWGVNKTTKGDFVLSKESADQIIQAWKDYGNKLNVDYNHAQLFSINPDESISAGSFDLELRDNGLFAINIEWTDKAKQLIEAKEYLYISPAFLTNDEGEVVELINFALTNIPATKNMDQLLAAFKLFLNKDIIMEENKEQELVDVPMEDQEQMVDHSEEEVDYKVMYEELKSEIEKIKEFVGFKEEESMQEPVEEELSNKESEDKTEEELDKVELDRVELLSKELESVKKDYMVALGIFEGKVLPSEKESLTMLSISELEKAISSRKSIKLSQKDQIIDVSVLDSNQDPDREKRIIEQAKRLGLK